MSKTGQSQKASYLWSVTRLVATVVAVLFLWISCLTFDPADWPNPNTYPTTGDTRNLCGPAGAYVAYQLFHYLGDGTYPLILFCTMAALMLLAGGSSQGMFLRLTGAAMLIVVTAAISHMIQPRTVMGLPVGSGGIVGFAAVAFLTQFFSTFGTVLILLLTLAIGLILVADDLVIQMPVFFKHTARGARCLAEQARTLTQWRPLPAAAGATSPGQSTRGKTAVSDDPVDQERHEQFDAEDEEDDHHEPQCVHETPQEPAAVRLEPKIFSAKALIESRKSKEPPAAWPRKLGDWQLPPLDLLSDEKQTLPDNHEQIVRGKARVLERTLREFKIEAVVVEIDTGPVVTMYELQLGPGIKVKSISERSKDMARALKAPAVRVIAPIPGKNTIGVEVPNMEKQPVRLRELVELSGSAPRKMRIPLFLGKDVSGNPLVTDLTAMPHLLIAGTTGSGKSVCINSIIMSMLLTQRPDHVKMILVDPKMVELSMFKEIPHLMCPVVHDTEKAEAILDWLVQKMEERYAILSEAQVRNIAAYNRLTEEQLIERFQPANDDEKARIPTFLPYIVLVIDELADMMIISPKEVEMYLARLAQKSRAVGIHIIMATQRPEAKVVTGLIKSNMPSRIAFRVNSRLDSRIVLDQNGAEDLLGQGDMLFLPPGSAAPTRAQGTLVDESELKRVLGYLKQRAEPEFHQELMQIGQANLDIDNRDELFDEAVTIILQSQRGSVSLLQRRLNVGYSRASRLIDQMAAAGIVGDYKGSQAREVLMTLEEYQKLKQQMESEIEQGYTD